MKHLLVATLLLSSCASKQALEKSAQIHPSKRAEGPKLNESIQTKAISSRYMDLTPTVLQRGGCTAIGGPSSNEGRFPRPLENRVIHILAQAMVKQGFKFYADRKLEYEVDYKMLNEETKHGTVRCVDVWVRRFSDKKVVWQGRGCAVGQASQDELTVAAAEAVAKEFPN